MSHPLKVCHSIENVQRLVRRTEELSDCKFVVVQKQRFYGNDEWKPLPSHRVFWKHPMPSGAVQIPYDGTPFIFVGKKVIGCHQGTSKSKATRLKYEQCKDDIKPKLRASKKRNCPAKIFTVQIAKFPDYKVKRNTELQKRRASMKLREHLKKQEDVRYEMRFITRDARSSDHRGHLVPVEAKEEEDDPFWELLDPTNPVSTSTQGRSSHEEAVAREKVLTPKVVMRTSENRDHPVAPKRRKRKRRKESIVVEVLESPGNVVDPNEQPKVKNSSGNTQSRQSSVSVAAPCDEGKVPTNETPESHKVTTTLGNPPLEPSPTKDPLQNDVPPEVVESTSGAKEHFLDGMANRMRRVPHGKLLKVQSDIMKIFDDIIDNR